MSMKQCIRQILGSGRPLPILSFPSVSLIGTDVYTLTHDAATQADGICAIAARTDSAAAVTMMDLSVEAEAFGCEIKASKNEIPTVVGALVTDEYEADALGVPEVGAGRTGLYVEAARMAKDRIKDRPVLAGMIGPFSLAGRLMDVSEALVNCITDPDMVHKTLRKVTPFLIAYAKAFRAAGLDGIVIAEPLSGLLSPALEAEFSTPYVRELIASVSSDDFAVIYHNCGPNTPLMTESLKTLGADAYHFGNAVDITVMLERMGSDAVVCGNIAPSDLFVGGSPDSMRTAVLALCEKTRAYPSFVLSSGCDIPPQTPWNNIDAFFAAAREAHGLK